jgi:hypothetical protein
MMERILIVTILIIVTIYLPYFFGKLLDRIFDLCGDSDSGFMYYLSTWYIGFAILSFLSFIYSIFHSVLIPFIIYGK